MIVVDVSLRASLEGVDRWLDFVRDSRGQDAVIFLVGNKADINEREVPRKELEEYAEKNRYPYVEVSAKNGSNIHALFRKIAERLIDGKNGGKESSEKDKEKEKEKESKAGNIALSKKDAVEGKQQCQC
jgi:GTPase SAR1 family protein